jgi:hypothetical protein
MGFATWSPLTTACAVKTPSMSPNQPENFPYQSTVASRAVSNFVRCFQPSLCNLEPSTA